jgi:hypothetical protein
MDNLRAMHLVPAPSTANKVYRTLEAFFCVFRFLLLDEYGVCVIDECPLGYTWLRMEEHCVMHLVDKSINNVK